MELTGRAQFISARSGTKKNGEPWYGLKFLDSSAEEFFMSFVDEQMFNQYEVLSKGTQVQLTVNLVPGKKYFELEKINKL